MPARIHIFRYLDKASTVLAALLRLNIIICHTRHRQNRIVSFRLGLQTPFQTTPHAIVGPIQDPTAHASFR
jgi:hypothetical protein